MYIIISIDQTNSNDTSELELAAAVSDQQFSETNTKTTKKVIRISFKGISITHQLH